MEYNSQVPIFNYDRVGICVSGDKALVNIDVSYGLFRVVLLVSLWFSIILHVVGLIVNIELLIKKLVYVFLPYLRVKVCVQFVLNTFVVVFQ